ncbi:MAG: insulinase family protein [Ekhidna sp.]|nr:insulinase family protein [Ekhidna sp.]
MKPLLLYLLFSAIILIDCDAQPNWKSSNQIHQLSNGLQVLVIEDQSIPLVHYDMVFRFGAIAEDEETNGVAHLYEHMMLTASKSYPSTEQFTSEIERLGIALNGLTNEESVHYYFNLLSDNWEEGLALLADAVVNPLFFEDEIALQKSAVKDELKIFASDPYYLLGQATKKSLWGNENTKKDVSGDLNSILKVNQELFFKFQKEYHNPDQALLIIAGDIDREQAIGQVAEHFGTWKTNPNSTYLDDHNYSKLETDVYTLLEHKDMENPFLLVEWQGLDSDINEQIAAALFFYSLNMTSSQFFIGLNKEDYVYDYYAGVQFGSKSSRLFMEFDTDPKTTDDLLEWLQVQIVSWSEKDAISQDALALAKTKWEIESIYKQEKLSEYILELGDRWAIGDRDLSTEFQSRIQEVTVDDINKVVRKFLKQPKSYGLVIAPAQTKKLHKSIRNKFLTQ